MLYVICDLLNEVIDRILLTLLEALNSHCLINVKINWRIRD